MPRQTRHQRYEVTRLDTPEDFLNLLRGKQQLSSDYQVAAYLDISHQAVSRYRRGDAGFDEKVSLKVAAGCGLDPAVVLTAMAHFRYVTPEAKEAAQRMLALLRSSKAAAAWLAIAIATACFGLAPQPAHARFNNNVFAVTFPAGPVRAQCDRNTHCAARRRTLVRSAGAAIAAFLAWLAGALL